MRIKSKILLNSSLSLVIILIGGALFLFSVNKSIEENEKNEVANKISKNILELNILTNEYVNGRTEQSKKQWLLNYQSSYSNLDSSLFDKQDESEIINRIKEEHEEVKELFLQISNMEVNIELEEIIRKQLSLKSQSISSESFKLSNLLREKSKKFQQQSIIIFIIFVISLTGISFLINLRITKSILIPLSYIIQGTKEIERGNFRSRININTGDEIEELAESFNKTMGKLEEIDIKKNELEHAKTEFLSVTSHELRSPMTPMRAQLQMLKDEYFGSLTPKQYSAIEIVLRNTERLDKIIRDLLEISRIEAARLNFSFVNVNLTDYVRNVIDEMSVFLIEKNIKLILKIGKIPKIECDPDRVMQVLRNLLENSIKFSKKNNRVIVSIQKIENFIHFSVKDFGIGISKENQKRLFEPFFQGEKTIYRKYGGTGLGLSICRGIVESQNGKILCNSKLGIGTEFRFTIPLKPVKDIKPIKVMFSKSLEPQSKIVDIFKEFLGPISDTEIGILKKKTKEEELSYEQIKEYIETLVNTNILDKEIGKKFQIRIGNFFGEIINPEVETLMEISENGKQTKNIIQMMVSLVYKLYGETAIIKANSINGLKVSKDGKLLSLTGDGNKILKSLGTTYIDLVGDIARFLKRRNFK